MPLAQKTVNIIRKVHCGWLNGDIGLVEDDLLIAEVNNKVSFTVDSSRG